MEDLLSKKILKDVIDRDNKIKILMDVPASQNKVFNNIDDFEYEFLEGPDINIIIIKVKDTGDRLIYRTKDNIDEDRVIERMKNGIYQLIVQKE